MQRIAQAEGKKQFTCDIPCSSGHLTPRWASNGSCVQCSAERTSNHNKKNRKGPNGDAFRAKWKEERHRWKEKPGVIERLRVQSREGMAAFRERNPIHGRVQLANRRAKKLGIEGKLTIKEIEDLLEKQKHKCTGCFEKLEPDYHLDHIMPLRLNGLNVIKNIQIMCSKCNWKKHCLNPHDWARELGRLL